MAKRPEAQVVRIVSVEIPLYWMVELVVKFWIATIIATVLVTPVGLISGALLGFGVGDWIRR